MANWRGRRVTDAEWDRLNDQHQDAYDAAEAEILARLEAEHIAEFNTPFKPNMRHIHTMIMKIIGVA